MNSNHSDPIMSVLPSTTNSSGKILSTIYPVHFADTRLYPLPLNTSVELPFFDDPNVRKYLDQKFENGEILSRKQNMHNLYDYVYTALRPIVHEIKLGHCFTGNLSSDHIYPMRAHIRPGLGSPARPEKFKNRLVCGVPKITIIPEIQFAYPLFNYYQNVGYSPLLWRYETINGGWCKLRAEWYPHLARQLFFILSSDWSEFDHRLIFILIALFAHADMSYYDFSHYHPTSDYPWGKNYVNPQKMKNLYLWTLYATFSMPLLMPDGTLLMRKDRVMPSGIFRTQYFDSKVDGLMIVCCLEDAGFTVNTKKFLKLMGDDNISAILAKLPSLNRADLIEFIRERAAIRFDAKLSLDATAISDSLDHVELLAYRNFIGSPYRDTIRVLAQMLYPEREDYRLSVMKARCAGLLYASLYRNPRLVRFAQDVFAFLTEQGVSMSNSGYRAFLGKFDPNIAHLMDRPIHDDCLPTYLEVTQFLKSPRPRTIADRERYWPSDHFHEPPNPDSLADALSELKLD